MRDRLRLAALVRRALLTPALVGGAGLCVLIVLAATGVPSAKDLGPLAKNDDAAARDLVVKLSRDVEGTPSAADIRRARVPLPERERRLGAHPYHDLYTAAQRRYNVSWFLVAAIHYQETGFRRARARTRVRQRDHDAVMAIAAELRREGARGLGRRAVRATAARYGRDPDGRLSTAMVIERARAWRLLGVIPLPGSGELATPVKGTIGGCGYFGCPRPGHRHNGVDFLASAGTPVRAADAGRVAIVQNPGQSGGYGNFVCLQHRPHLATCYAHLSAFAPRLDVGDRIRRGEVLGLVGSTGSSTAPHLHFEVRRGAANCQACAVDPMPLLDGKVPQDGVPELLELPRQAPAPGSARAPSYVAPPAAPSGPPNPQPTPAPHPPPRGTTTTTPATPPAGQTGGATAPGSSAPKPKPKPTPAPKPKPTPAPAPPPPPAAPPDGGATAP